MSVEIIPNPNQLAHRVLDSENGLTLEQLLDRAEEIVAKTTNQWHAGIVEDVAFMLGQLTGRTVSNDEIAPVLIMFASILGDIEASAEELGYPDIRAAARDVSTAIFRIDTSAESGDQGSLNGQREAVTTCLALLRMRVVEASRVESSGGDLLAA